MQIQPATCPACGVSYDPLRAQAVTVIDGRVRAFCSTACRERGLAPPAPKRSATDSHTVITVHSDSSPGRRLPTEQRVLIAAAVTALAGFVVMIVLGRQKQTASAVVRSKVASRVSVQSKTSFPTSDTADVWIQPLARVGRPAIKHDRRLFLGREGIPVNECAGVRCSIEIDAVAGAVVMAVHDGVIETVERDAGAREEGRFIRINHRGGAIASSYFQLDGIREDLRPGIPVKAGEPIGTVARPTSSSTRPHFRFAMSVNNGVDDAMLFMDPQPLLALWPMRRDTPMSLRAMEHASSPSDSDDEAIRSNSGQTSGSDRPNALGSLRTGE